MEPREFSQAVGTVSHSHLPSPLFFDPSQPILILPSEKGGWGEEGEGSSLKELIPDQQLSIPWLLHILIKIF